MAVVAWWTTFRFDDIQFILLLLPSQQFIYFILQLFFVCLFIVVVFKFLVVVFCFVCLLLFLYFCCFVCFCCCFVYFYFIFLSRHFCFALFEPKHKSNTASRFSLTPLPHQHWPKWKAIKEEEINDFVTIQTDKGLKSPFNFFNFFKSEHDTTKLVRIFRTVPSSSNQGLKCWRIYHQRWPKWKAIKEEETNDFVTIKTNKRLKSPFEKILNRILQNMCWFFG